MATNRSFGNMLNENIYAGIQREKDQAKTLISKREKIRNEFIDKYGRKPSEQEIDAILTKAVSFGV